MIATTCDQCGSAFRAKKRKPGRGVSRFCSRGCFYLSMRLDRVTRACKTCGKSFQPAPNQVTLGVGFYCSVRCGLLARPATKAKYIGGGPSGQEHQRIAAKALGKPIPPGAHVHHVNLNGRDNRNRNLVICDSLAYHFLLHVRTRVLQAGGDPNTQRICSYCRRALAFDQFVGGGHMFKGGGIRGCCRRCGAARSDRKRRSLGIPESALARKYFSQVAIPDPNGELLS